MLVLRTAINCACEYEWSQHRILGVRAGLGTEEVERIIEGPGPSWDPFDNALLQTADELHQHCFIEDQTWDVLSQHYSDDQLIEVPMLVGHYEMVAMLVNSLGIQLDPGLQGW